MGYHSNTLPMGQEAPIAPWGGSDQPLLSQMVTGTETTSSEMNEGHVWGASPWLQQPMQRQANGLGPNSAIEALQSLKDPKLCREPAMCIQGEQSQQDADDGDLDIDSEIIGRAVRFIEELSTESGEEDDQLPISKEDTIRLPQARKDVFPASTNAAYRSMWNPQEPWVGDINAQDRWQSGLVRWDNL
jgi:hypothetical protein